MSVLPKCPKDDAKEAKVGPERGSAPEGPDKTKEPDAAEVHTTAEALRQVPRRGDSLGPFCNTGVPTRKNSAKNSRTNGEA